jgi:lipopolysaccharide assembly outer membrane protein LptD (OstA)
MKLRTGIHAATGLILTAKAVLLVALLFCLLAPLQAQDDASLHATSLALEETPTGAILTLIGPVEISFKGNTLKSDSAVVTLRSGAASLTEAIEQIELTGAVAFEGADGSRAGSSRAVYGGRDGLLVCRGGVSFSKGNMTATAGSVEYSSSTGALSLDGNVSLSQDAISATSDSARYNVNDQSGDLTGSVQVVYKSEQILFGSRPVDEIVLTAPSLHLSVADGIVETPSGGERTAITAGGYSFAADSVTFKGAQDQGLSEVLGTGNVQLEGAEGTLSADHATFSTADRIFRADGNVSFSILGQEGSAESIEVNFASGWSVRMTGGTVGGPLDSLQGN